MGKRVITVTLSKGSVDKAIAELKQYKRDIAEKTERLRKRIAERLREEVEQGFNNATGNDVIKGEVDKTSVDVTIAERGGISVVIASGKDVAFIEFGAGVYHNGEVGSSPNPKGNELGMTIGSYGKGHGVRSAWGYYGEDGELRITRGTPADMPMVRAVDTVTAELPEIVREVFA